MTIDAARSCTLQGGVGGVFAAIWGVAWSYAAAGGHWHDVPAVAWIVSALLVALSLGVFFRSRIAAAALLLVYVAPNLYTIAQARRLPSALSLVVFILLTLVFTRALRGTIACHKLRARPTAE